MSKIDTSKLVKKSEKDAQDKIALALVFEQATQKLIENTAKSMGYDSILSAVSYADEPAVAKFQQEGQALRRWRSLVWEYCYAELDKVKAGERTVPEIDAFLAELPALEAPSDAAP